MPNFQEIWDVFATGHGTIHGIDAISLSAIFRIAELELGGNSVGSADMLHGFKTHESCFLRGEVTSSQLDELINEIKRNTQFEGTMVFNADGRRRYDGLADVGFMVTPSGFKTVVLFENK